MGTEVQFCKMKKVLAKQLLTTFWGGGAVSNMKGFVS